MKKESKITHGTISNDPNKSVFHILEKAFLSTFLFVSCFKQTVCPILGHVQHIWIFLIQFCFKTAVESLQSRLHFVSTRTLLVRSERYMNGRDK